jgi:CBS-domain-containing membrane protein
VRRLPVVDRAKRLVGIVALSDLAHREDARAMGHAVAGISAPGGAHSQTAH